MNHCEPSESNKENVILKKNFSKALNDLKIQLVEQEMEELFKRVDVDCSESLTFDEIENIVSQPSELERWALSIPFHYLLADAISCIGGEGTDIMKKASNLSQSDIQEICIGVLAGMKKMMAAKVFELKQAFDAMDASLEEHAAASSKFTVGTMSSGGHEDFYKGLEGRIGPNHRRHSLVSSMRN